MSEKMLKFVEIGQQNPPKGKPIPEKRILMRYIKSSFMKVRKNNQADALNAVFLFAKFTVL